MSNIANIMGIAAAGPDPRRFIYVADYSATAIRTIDVTDPASPSVVATLTDATNFANITCLAIDLANNVLIAACFDTKVNAIDISNPLSLSVSDTYTFAAGTYTRHEGSLAIDTANQRVWLASGSSNYLYALDYSTPTSLSIAGSYNSAADADNLQNTMYVTSSQGDQSGEYVFSYEADDDALNSYDVSTIGSITHNRSRTDTTYIGTSQSALYYDDTNAWMWSAKTDRITAVDMNANGNAIPSGAWGYTSSTTRSGTAAGLRNIETGCLVVDESRKYGFTCGTYNVSTWDFSTSGLSKSSSDEYFSESLFFKGLAYDKTNQILYAAEQNDFYIFDVSDITNMTLSGSITDAVTLMYQGNGCVLGYDPTA